MVPVKMFSAKFGTNTKYCTNNVVLSMVGNQTISVPCLAVRRQMVPAINFVTQMRIKILVCILILVPKFNDWYQILSMRWTPII